MENNLVNLNQHKPSRLPKSNLQSLRGGDHSHHHSHLHHHHSHLNNHNLPQNPQPPPIQQISTSYFQPKFMVQQHARKSRIKKLKDQRDKVKSDDMGLIVNDNVLGQEGMVVDMDNNEGRGRGERSNTNLTGKKRKKLDETETDKRKRRLVRNRQAAQASRERKKKYIKRIENENSEYKKRILYLEKELYACKNFIKTVCPGNIPIIPPTINQSLERLPPPPPPQIHDNQNGNVTVDVGVGVGINNKQHVNEMTNVHMNNPH